MTNKRFPDRLRPLAGLVLSLLFLLAPSAASALGLGAIKVKSFLNQPLKAEIQLIRSADEDVSAARATVAPQEAFERVGLTRNAVTNNMKFKVVGGESPASPARLLVTTTDVVKEPVLSFLVELDWPTGKVIREYTILLDPPVTPQTEAAMAPQQPPQVRPAPLPQPVAPAPQRNRPLPQATRPAPAPQTGVPPLGQPTAPVRPVAPQRPAAPVRPAPPAPTASAPGSGGTYGPVSPQETLWSIAYKLRPNARTITMDQMQIAMLQANPRAFEGNNINRLIKGSVLRVPTEQEILAIDAGSARQAVARQKAAFAGSTDAPDTRPSLEPAQRDTESVRSAAQAEPVTSLPEPPAVDDESGSPADSPADTDADDAEGEEGVAAAVDPDTETALATMVEQAEAVQAEQGAAVQEPDAESAAADSDTAGTAVDNAQVDPDSAQEGIDAADAGDGVPESIYTDDAGDVVEDVDVEPASEPREEGGIGSIDWTPPGGSNLLTPLNLAGGAAILALIIGALWYNRKRRNKEAMAEAEFDKQLREQSIEDVTAAGAGGADTPLGGAEVEAGSDEAGSPDEVLSEVDMHMAYGLYEECENMLKPTIAANPDRVDLKVKLLEVYQASGNSAAFEKLATEVKGQVGEADPQWQRVAEMGRKLLPGAALFGAAAATSSASNEGSQSDDEASAAEAVEAAMSGSTVDNADDDAGTDHLDALLSGEVAAEPEPAETGDFDFDSLSRSLDEDDAGNAERSADADSTTDDEGGGAGEGLEFDLEELDFGLDEDKPDTGKDIADTGKESQSGAAEGLDFDFDASAESPGAATQDADDETGLPAEDVEAESAEPEEPSSGESNVDFDLEAETAEIPAAAKSDAGADDETGSASSEEMSTKLDLARAYIDMGEPGMAESLLQEVIEGGNSQQKAEAEELLNSTG